MTVFTLANIGDTSGAISATATPFSLSTVVSAVLCTVAAAASVALLSTPYVPGQTVTVVDAASFAGRPGAPITITIISSGTIDGLANKKITTPGGSVTLMLISGTAWQTVGHNP